MELLRKIKKSNLKSLRMKGDIVLKNISKLSDKCRKCSYFDECNNKRMVACVISEYKPNRASTTVTMTTPLSQHLKRVENPITINMGECGTINTSLEEIAEKLKKDFYKHLNCSFNR